MNISPRLRRIDDRRRERIKEVEGALEKLIERMQLDYPDNQFDGVEACTEWYESGREILSEAQKVLGTVTQLPDGGGK